MTYAIRGLDPAPYRHLFQADSATLEAAHARIVIATSDAGFPCRAALREAKAGDRLLLTRHVSNDPAGPFRIAHAIYVGEGAQPAPVMRDRVPEMLDRRTIGLRAFDAEGVLCEGELALPGEADAAIQRLFADRRIAYIHAHNAILGCFLAAVERADD